MDEVPIGAERPRFNLDERIDSLIFAAPITARSQIAFAGMSTIDQLLNQVPYRNRPRVKADIEAATVGAQKMGSLTPKIGNFGTFRSLIVPVKALSSNQSVSPLCVAVHVDGAENKLVFLSGTIPIFYGGATVSPASHCPLLPHHSPALNYAVQHPRGRLHAHELPHRDAVYVRAAHWQ